jgi:hypothetical protein
MIAERFSCHSLKVKIALSELLQGTPPLFDRHALVVQNRKCICERRPNLG